MIMHHSCRNRHVTQYSDGVTIWGNKCDLPDIHLTAKGCSASGYPIIYTCSVLSFITDRDILQWLLQCNTNTAANFYSLHDHLCCLLSDRDTCNAGLGSNTGHNCKKNQGWRPCVIVLTSRDCSINSPSLRNAVQQEATRLGYTKLTAIANIAYVSWLLHQLL